MQTYISKSKEQTQKIAGNFAKKLKGGEVLCFYGNLGSGKTTFIQAMAKAVGVKENITSPTYVLLKKYLISQPNKLISYKLQAFYHLDAYRLSNSQEALDLDLEEIWSGPQNIIAIEWADKICDILPAKRIDLCFEHIGENERKITIFN